MNPGSAVGCPVSPCRCPSWAAANGKQEGEGQYMPGLSIGNTAAIALVIGLAVSGCDMSNNNPPDTTTGGATTGGVTSRGGIGSTGIDGSTTRGGTGDIGDMDDTVGSG